MALLGPFVGIDRYASQRVNWLSCAKRDVVALHALFTDTLGGDSLLLTDEEATRAKIEGHFQILSQCSPRIGISNGILAPASRARTPRRPRPRRQPSPRSA